MADHGTKVAEALGIKLGCMSYKQTLSEGKEFREWIVKRVKALKKERLFVAARELTGGAHRSKAPVDLG